MFDIPGLGVPELVLLLVLALVLFGPGKLPDIGRSLGRAINEFKAASREISREYREEAASGPVAVPARPQAGGPRPEDGEPGGDGPERSSGSGPR